MCMSVCHLVNGFEYNFIQLKLCSALVFYVFCYHCAKPIFKKPKHFLFDLLSSAASHCGHKLSIDESFIDSPLLQLQE